MTNIFIALVSFAIGYVLAFYFERKEPTELPPLKLPLLREKTEGECRKHDTCHALILKQCVSGFCKSCCDFWCKCRIDGVTQEKEWADIINE